MSDPTPTVDELIKHAERLKRYEDPVEFERRIILLADEVVRLRRELRLSKIGRKQVRA